MQKQHSCLVFLLASIYILLACDLSYAQGLWTKAKDALSTGGSRVGDAIGGLNEQLPKWDPTNPESDFNDWLKRRDPGIRVNKEAERTGRKFGEGFIEGAKPGIDLMIDGAGKKALEVSERVNADILETGTKLLDGAEKAAGRLLVEGEGAANRVIDKTFAEAKETIKEGGQVASSVIKDAMNRQAKIVDDSLTRIENLSDNALSRIEYLQSDSMGRIEAAISDQVPFTASDLFAQAEAFVLLLTVACFLLGAIVFYLKEDGTFKRTMKEPFNWSSVWGRSVEAFSIGSRVLLRFGPPLVFSALLVHILYTWHYTTSRTSRLQTLIAAAEDAENAGDFRTAATFRMRLCRLSPKQKYMYEFKRDTFLSKYYQGHNKLSDDQIYSSVIRLLEADPNGDYLPSDLESLCLICYEASKSPINLRQGLIEAAISVKQENSGKTSFLAFLDDLKSRLVKMKEEGKRLPFGGKFVFIALIKQVLGPSDAKSVEDRLKAAEEIARQLVECYPKYPAGLKAASIIGASRLHSVEWLPSWKDVFPGQGDSEAINAYKTVQQEIDSLNYLSNLATALDPLFSELVTLEQEIAPQSIIDTCEKIQELRKANSAEADTAIQSIKDNEEVKTYIAQLNYKASRIYGNGPLARLFAEQCVVEAINRGVSIKQMMSQIITARGLLDNDEQGRVAQYEACLEASKMAVKAGQLYVAERWLDKATGINLQDVANRNTTLEDEIRKGLQGDLAKVVCCLLD